jgi:hypothetical protein
MSYLGLRKVISGGQTGADAGGLIAAFKMGIQTGGTAPNDWMTSIGSNPLLQLLGLTASGTLKTRTVQNVLDSDGTLIFTVNAQSPGSVQTANVCTQNKKPFFEVDLNSFLDDYLQPNNNLSTDVYSVADDIASFIVDNNINVLNVAGNREHMAYAKLFITRQTEKLCSQTFKLLDVQGLLLRDADIF